MLVRLREKHIQNWVAAYLQGRLRLALARAAAGGPRHLLFAICDHWEPGRDNAAPAVAAQRARRWELGYPAMAAGFCDADGCPPRHTFFFPGEQYSPALLDILGPLVRDGFGEVELHLHHGGDTAASLRDKILASLDRLAGHGHLSRDGDGRLRYAFIHGDWSLANARRDGSCCGVDAELPLLFETGCYADFTFPSAPDETQPAVVNRIYWPAGDLQRRRAYDLGEPARVGRRETDRLLFIQGPLALARRPGSLSLRIENAHLTEHDPPTAARIHTWVGQQIHVVGRPEWIFVKVHTHGALESTARSLLGDAGRALHRELASRYNDGRRWLLHYVTAREMYNIAVAAMDGCRGSPADYRDYLLEPPPARSAPGRSAS